MPDSDRPDPHADREDDESPRGVDLWLVPFVTDSTLWPVLVVAIAAAVSLGVSLVTLVWSDRNPLAGAALVAVVWMSVDMVLRERRAGGSGWVLRLVAAVWVLIAGCSAALVALGWI